MKWLRLSACLLFWGIVLATSVTAQDTCYVVHGDVNSVILQLDLGICDTVRLGCPMTVSLDSLSAGDSIRIPFYFWNDYPIGSFSIGFVQHGTNVRFGKGWVANPTGPMPSNSGMLKSRTSMNGDTILVGWIDVTGETAVAVSNGNTAEIVGYFFLKLEQLTPQTILMDSTWVAPAGPFILVPNYEEGRLPIKLVPKFPGCSGITLTAGIACGDVNGSQKVNISDAVYMVNYIFGDGPAPQDISHGDVNCDGSANLADVVYLVNYIFAGGPAPCSGC
jgi:hypothetical protein